MVRLCGLRYSRTDSFRGVFSIQRSRHQHTADAISFWRRICHATARVHSFRSYGRQTWTQSSHGLDYLSHGGLHCQHRAHSFLCLDWNCRANYSDYLPSPARIVNRWRMGRLYGFSRGICEKQRARLPRFLAAGRRGGGFHDRRVGGRHHDVYHEQGQLNFLGMATAVYGRRRHSWLRGLVYTFPD